MKIQQSEKILLICILMAFFAGLLFGDMSCPKGEAQEKKENYIQIDRNVQIRKMDTVEVQYPGDSLKVIFAGKEFVTDYNVYMFMGLLAMHSEMKNYEMECYADSELVKMGLFYTFEGNTFKAIYDPKPYESIGNLIEVNDEWIHQDPTFPGFIKFLDDRFAGVK